MAVISSYIMIWQFIVQLPPAVSPVYSHRFVEISVKSFLGNSSRQAGQTVTAAQLPAVTNKHRDRPPLLYYDSMFSTRRLLEFIIVSLQPQPSMETYKRPQLS